MTAANDKLKTSVKKAWMKPVLIAVEENRAASGIASSAGAIGDGTYSTS